MIAMENGDEERGEMISAYTCPQPAAPGGITKELTEIVGGAEALK